MLFYYTVLSAINDVRKEKTRQGEEHKHRNISLSRRYKLFAIRKFSILYNVKTSQKSTDHTMNTKYTKTTAFI
jgi:hypothetical protein